MANLLINQWWGGIGDDIFLSRPWECLDMDGIDIRTTPRRITSDTTFLGSSATTSNNINDTLNYAIETVDWLIQCYSTRNYANNTNISALTGTTWADISLSVGSNTSDYNSSTNPEWVRHFFFSYNGSTNPVYVVWYSGWVRAALSNFNTSGGASPADIVAVNRTTAVCYLWKGSAIFARGNKIYEINPSTATLSAGFKVELPLGAVVKAIYYTWGLIYFVYTISGNISWTGDTYIHGCSYQEQVFTLYPNADKIPGEKCLSATLTPKGIMWISTTGIFLWGQLLKKYTLSTSALCSYNKGIFRVIDGQNFIEYGVNKPWYGSPLTKNVLASYTWVWITQNYVITFDGGTSVFRYDQQSSYKASNYYILHPYTAWQMWIKKKWLWFKIGYRLPQSYVSWTTKCSIVVAVQTEAIEAINTSTYVTVATINDTYKSQSFFDITPSMIRTAMETAGYSDEFAYIRVKITLNNGDPSWVFYTKTPEVYDLYYNHTEIEQ